MKWSIAQWMPIATSMAGDAPDAARARAAGADQGAGPRRGGVLRVLLPLLLVVLVAATVAVFYLVARQAEVDQRMLAVLDGQQLLSQTVAKETAAATRGDLQAFERLGRASDQFDATLRLLREGDASVPALPVAPALDQAYAALVDGWQPIRENINVVLESRDALVGVRAAASDYEAQRSVLAGQVDVILDRMAAAYVRPDQLLWASRMASPVQSISDGLARTVAGGAAGADAAYRFQSDAAEVRYLIDGFLRGEYALGIERSEDPTVRAELTELSDMFKPVESIVGTAYELSFRLLRQQEAGNAVLAEDTANLARVRDLRQAYVEHAGARPLSPLLGTGLGIAALLALLALVAQMTGDARRRAEQERVAAEDARRREEETSRINQANQEAILRLLDEISDLADGDLTINATVTEDITGAIADAINYAVDALRDTVGRINETSLSMAGAAQRSRSDAEALTRSAETQAAQIESAASTIRDLAEAARTVSGSAERGRDVAEQSVRYANEGSSAVRATIDGMDSIRENIQETSKRIKRLGESSQEIGDIVGLIDDIADQTNILALNAAIQASMAGEQGRGFAVVADEVQRLAERAGQATRQIEGLVKAIQSDTSEAVASMEQSTAGVVQGADLAEDAGQALVRIELVSRELSELVASISESATGQTGQAAEASRLMEEIQRITTSTRSGTEATAAAVEALAQQAADLRTSVAGFRLPESTAPAAGAQVVGIASGAGTAGEAADEPALQHAGSRAGAGQD